ncbi:MAG: hypothetical protein Q9160_007966 [Pyrenula sp. 1 TL-2023]
MGSLPVNAREELMASLEGQKALIPDLRPLLSHWPQKANPQENRLEKDVDAYLNNLFPPGKRLAKMKAANAAQFASAWWPYASYLYGTMTDSLEFSSIAEKWRSGKAYREETMLYISACLSGNFDVAARMSTNPFITNFEPVARSLLGKISPVQNAVLLRELEWFVDMVGLEHQYVVKGQLPSVEEYIERRKGSSAVTVCLAITETNDILSIKKELAQNQVDSLLPLLYARHHSLSSSISIAVDMLSTSIASLDRCSERLLAQHPPETDVGRHVQEFVDGCKYACTANLVWR